MGGGGCCRQGMRVEQQQAVTYLLLVPLPDMARSCCCGH